MDLFPDIVTAVTRLEQNGYTPHAFYLGGEDGDDCSIWCDVYGVFTCDEGEDSDERFAELCRDLPTQVFSYKGSTCEHDGRLYRDVYLGDAPCGDHGDHMLVATGLALRLARRFGCPMYEAANWRELEPYVYQDPELPLPEPTTSLPLDETRRIFSGERLPQELRHLNQLSIFDGVDESLWQQIPQRCLAEDRRVAELVASRVEEIRGDGGLVVVNLRGAHAIAAAVVLARAGFAPAFIMGPHLNREKDFLQELAAARQYAEPLRCALDRCDPGWPLALIADRACEVCDHLRASRWQSAKLAYPWLEMIRVRRFYRSLVLESVRHHRGTYRRPVGPTPRLLAERYRSKICLITETGEPQNGVRVFTDDDPRYFPLYPPTTEIALFGINPYAAGNFPESVSLGQADR